MGNQFFVFRGIDRPDSARLREELTPRHRDYVRNSRMIVMLHGGPLYGVEGETIGTCLILAAPSKADITDWLEKAPFYSAGLFGSTTVEHWGWTYGR